MESRWLRYFVAVYEEGSLSAAAKRLFVAQPSISTTLAQLEERLGVRLFLRHQRGVTATPEGERFYASAVALLGDMRATEAMFREASPPPSLSLAVMAAINAQRVAALVRALRRELEGLVLRIVEPTEAAQARIVSDRLSLPGEAFIHLWDERYVLALPPGHPLSRNATVNLEDLHGIALIERCYCELHDEVAAALARHEVRPDIVAKAQSEEWALALVAAGLGVCLVPEGSVNTATGVTVRPVTGLKLVRRVGLAYDQGKAAAAPLQTAIRLARSGVL